MDEFKLLEHVTGLAIVTPMELDLISSSLGLNAADLAKIQSCKYKYTLTLTQRGWFVLCDRRVNPFLFLVWRECLKLSGVTPIISKNLSPKCYRPAAQSMYETRLLRTAEDV